MSLSSYLQPIEPPEDGLADVRRRSQQRARRYRVASGLASITASFVLIGFAALNANSSTSTASDSASIPHGGGGRVGGVTQPTGSSIGLPGGTVASSMADGLVYYGAILAIALGLIGIVWSVASTRREPEPSLRPRGVGLALLIAGALVALLVVFLSFL